MDVRDFENKRWQREDQKPEWRHKTALGLVEKGTVLDLGSGDGLFLSLLRDRGILGEGVDLSEEGVRKANAKGLRTKVFDFGNNKLPYPDNSFDTVVCLDVLEHLYDPESLLREASRVAKRHVVIGVPNFSSFPARLQTLFGRVPENNRPKKGHIYWFNHDVLEHMACRTGLLIDLLRSNTVYESIPGVSLLTKNLAKILPNLMALSFVVRLKK